MAICEDAERDGRAQSLEAKKAAIAAFLTELVNRHLASETDRYNAVPRFSGAGKTSRVREALLATAKRVQICRSARWR